MENSEGRSNIINNELIKYAILVYWSLFWLFNSLDKIIGGSEFLWVGRDRFAQFQKFFASASLEAPIYADAALIIVGALEIFAFVFFTGALFHFVKKNQESARSWFFVGILLTLITFTIFAIGDHIFGDRFELLEHTLFWFMTLSSWVVFIRIGAVDSTEKSNIGKRQIIIASIITLALAITTSASIFKHNTDYFSQRSEPVNAEKAGDNLYKFSFPFLGGSTVFENSIEKFRKEYPNKKINHIYTAPGELRLKKADGLIFYVITEDKK